MCRRFIPVSTEYDGDKFFTMENGVRTATPLLLALAVVELSDVVFAVDSVPAVRSTVQHWPCAGDGERAYAALHVRAKPKAANAT
jgi:predicted tellurium resistance membrane protein TerC